MLQTRNAKLIAGFLALILLILMGARYLEAGQKTVAYPPSSDFYKFYLSGERLAKGQSIYWIIPPRIRPGDPCHPDALRENGQPGNGTASKLSLGGALPCLAPNLNPPFFMVLIAPLALLDFTQAWWTWAAFSMGSLALSLWWLVGAVVRNRTSQAVLTSLGMGLLMAYHPVYINFVLGQVGTLLLLPLTLSWRALRQGKAWQAGCWLGLATGLKPFLILFLLPLLLTRRWQASAAMTVTLLCTGLVGWVWLGSDTYAHYQLVASHVTWTTSNWNGSIVGFVDRAFSGVDPKTWPLARQLACGLGIGLSGIVLLLVCWALCSERPAIGGITPDLHADRLFMLMVPASVLVSPLGWLYYLPWLLICSTVLWQWTVNQAQGRAWRLAWVAALLATLAPIEMKPIPTLKNPTYWWGIDALYAYSLITAFAVMLLLTRPAAVSQQKQAPD